MSRRERASYGTWESPITSDLIVQGVIGLDEILLDGADVYWREMRPTEAGRYVVVRRGADGAREDVTPAPFNARTRVHEYGGGGALVHDGTLYFSNFSDQRVYRRRRGSPPEPVTPAAAMRYADGVFDARRGRILCVREDHTVESREAVNTIVAIDPDGGGDPGRVLASGADFYSSPRLDPDGERLAWISWNHPNMPWDGTELWVARIAPDGSLAAPERVAGGAEESVLQPLWSPDGDLYFVSDRSGWWNLHRRRGGRVEPVLAKDSEFAGPHWVFGLASYGFESRDALLCAYSERGMARLGRLDTRRLELEEIGTPYTSIATLKVGSGFCVLGAGTPSAPSEIARLDLSSRRLDVLRKSSDLAVDSRYLSQPEPISFPTTGGRTAYAFHYPPANGDFEPPPGERPPLLVKVHGGPTSSARTVFNLGIQYWTSRGFAVLDVNYGGSTGYGRAYRNRLRGQWGVVDVEDCVNAARFLVERRKADPERLAIDGGSAGGYTTLCALTFHDLFSAGASMFGVSDLTMFTGDTHKFESRYLESLVGPFPEKRKLYEERSPLRYVERLSRPVIFFQGDEDRIVPPNQTEIMVEALRKKGIPVAYLLYEGEQHGFRKAENIKRTLDAELYFYSRIFGFRPAGELEPVEIRNLAEGLRNPA
jgi:dipeptidyl aminopeptidase/acylaminoacyl peptidase